MAIGDRILYPYRSEPFPVPAQKRPALTCHPLSIRYLAFYEYDLKAKRKPAGLPCKYKLFGSRRGFHAIGCRLIRTQEKKTWFNIWQNVLPSDYLIRNWNFLRPSSIKELLFILELCAGSEARFVTYWKDDLYPEQNELVPTTISSGNGWRRQIIKNFLNGSGTPIDGNAPLSVTSYLDAVQDGRSD